MLPLLGAAAVGLAGLLAWEAVSLPASPALPDRPRHDAAPLASAVRETDATGARTQTLLLRPLFSPDRRPPPVALSAGGKEAEMPRLSGVLIGPSWRRAIFAGGVVVAEGGALGRYTVRTIEDGRVTVLGPDGVRILQPVFAADTTRPPAEHPAAPSVPAAPPTPAILSAPK